MGSQMNATRRTTVRVLGPVLVILGGTGVALLAGAGASAAPSVRPAPPSAVAPAAAPAAEAPAARAAQARRRSFPYPTTSSPITISRDGRYVWTVNPGADTVSVIRTANNQVVRTVGVGDEPQSVALDPNDRYAFVANAAGNSVTVIRIRISGGTLRAQRVRSFTTGAEPWNVVVSPDGRRAFVANSAQDTVTVLDALRPRIIGHVDLQRSRCNPNTDQHFQPRGLAVTRDSNRLYVTSFLAFTRPGGRQADDNGKQGVVCRLRIDTESRDIDDYSPRRRITLAPQVTGFTVDRDGNGTPDPTSAFPNQMQSIVIRGGQAYLPNIAASPDGPQRFNTSTQAFLSVVNGVRQDRERDAAPGRFLNLHLGARQPEAGKKRLFFANPWAVGFTSQSGNGNAYVVSAGSDLLVKVRVGGDGRLAFTVDADTTRYVDLNDPGNPATAGANAGKNPQGIAINRAGSRAYVTNFVSRNVSVVDLGQDRVIRTIRTSAPPRRGLAGRGRGRRRGDVLLLARRVQPPGRRGRVDHRAAVQRRLAGLQQLPLQGADRRRGLGVRHRPAQVGAAEPDVQPAQPRPAADPQLLGDLRRARGLRGQRAQRVRPRGARDPGRVLGTAAGDEHARPQPRADHRRRRQHQQRRRAWSTRCSSPTPTASR